MCIELIVADDHAVVLEVVKGRFDQHDDITVVGTANDSTEVVELLSRRSCDVLVTDYEMPGGAYGDGLPYLIFLKNRFPNLKIIVYTTADMRNVESAVTPTGYFSFLQKSVDIEELVSTVRRVADGQDAFYKTQKNEGSRS